MAQTLPTRLVPDETSLSFDLTGSSVKQTPKTVPAPSAPAKGKSVPLTNYNPSLENKQIDDTLAEITGKDFVYANKDIQDKHSEKAKDIQTDFRDSDKTDTYKAYYNNLTKQDPRGTLNQRTFDDTLALSRMTDRLNQHLWRTPVALRIGSQNVGSFNAADVDGMVARAKPHRMQPIETEETRQMGANRGIDQMRRAADVQLQSDIQRYDFDLQKATDEDRRTINTFMSQLDAGVVKDLKSSAVNLFTEAGRSDIARKAFLYQLQKGTQHKAEIAAAVEQALQSRPIMSAMFADSMGLTTPTIDQQLLNATVADYLRIADEQGLNNDDKVAGYYQLLIRLFGGVAGDLFSGVKDQASGLIFNKEEE